MSNESGGKGSALPYYKVTVALVTGLAWPILATVLLVTFRGSVATTVQTVTAKLERANKMAFGGFLFEIGEQARAMGNPEVAGRLQGLSSDGVHLLMELGTSRRRLAAMVKDPESPGAYSIPGASEMRSIRELEAKRLIAFSEDIEAFLRWIHGNQFKVTMHHYPNGTSRLLVQPRGPLTAADMGRIEGESFMLSDDGKAAWEAILAAVDALLAEAK